MKTILFFAVLVYSFLVNAQSPVDICTEKIKSELVHEESTPVQVVFIHQELNSLIFSVGYIENGSFFNGWIRCYEDQKQALEVVNSFGL